MTDTSWSLAPGPIVLCTAVAVLYARRWQVARALERLPGVVGTHHLHIWSLSTTETALTVHLQVGEDVDRDLILRQANQYVHQLFGIDHSTIQVERLAAASAADCHDDDCGHQ